MLIKLEVMKYHIFICILIICASCNTQSQIPNEYKLVPKYSTIIHPDFGKQMLKQRGRHRPENISSYFLLKKKDINILENNFYKLLDIIPADIEEHRDCQISPLNAYGFQYMGVVIKEKKYIYLSAFLTTKSSLWEYFYNKIDWKTEPIVVQGGGCAFWGALFDIEKQTFSEFEVNMPR